MVKIPIIFGENNFKPIRYLYERPTIIPDSRVLKPRSNIVLTVADTGKVMFSVVCLSVYLFTGESPPYWDPALPAPPHFFVCLPLDMFTLVHYVANTLGKAGDWHSTETPFS